MVGSPPRRCQTTLRGFALLLPFRTGDVEESTGRRDGQKGGMSIVEFVDGEKGGLTRVMTSDRGRRPVMTTRLRG